MTPTTRKIQGGIYCRISDDRAGGGLGVERQRKDCVRLAARLGWAVADSYTDNDISAFTGKRRPEYERLLADITAGRITGLITWHPDRLNRSPLELERLIGVLERSGVSVQSVTAGFLDLATPSGRAVARTLGAWARFESEHKSERIIAKKLEQAMAGTVHRGGQRPYGYAYDGFTIIDDEAEVIREVMRRFLAGQSLNVIAKDLRARGVTTTNGGNWTPSRLSRTLACGRIAGWRDKAIREGAGERTRTTEFLAKGQWEPIVSRRSVQRARVLLRDDTIRPGSHLKFLLSGILRCSLCDHAMVSQMIDSPRRRYKCGDSGRTGGCGRLSVTSMVETTFIEQLNLAVTAGLIDRVIDAGIDSNSAAIEADAQIRQWLRKAHHDLIDGAISHDEFISQRSKLGHRGRTTRRVANDLAGISLAELSTPAFPTIWERVNMRGKRGIIRTLTSDITIKAGDGSKNYDPERLSVTWRK
jgi:site-specific DNA recombinase